MAEGSDNPNPARSAPDPERWLDVHGDALYRYARLHVSDDHAAEDLVQDTLLAAMQAADRFRGDAQERTWLIGILKHKLIDHLRAVGRRPVGPSLDAVDEAVSAQFTRRGLWQQPPRKWSRDPADGVQQAEFWDVLQQCLDFLPAPMAYAFLQRELADNDSESICQDLAVTATNLWTLLHRARTRLRRCLEEHWFRDAETG